MTVDTVRTICRTMPGATEDLKWGADLAFSVGGKMFCVVNTEPPHQMSFKCTPDDFAELIEREGLIPAPYLARAMWVQQSELAGEVLDRRELQQLLQTSYDLVVAKLPKSKRPGTVQKTPAKAGEKTRAKTSRAKTKRQ
jgi:predicted DNA-binding protein (MmcQ/YjbR family)